MKRIIIVLSIMLVGAAIPVAALATTSGLHVIYKKGGITCADKITEGYKTVACGLTDGSGYMVGINKYVVAVSNATGKLVYTKAQP